MTDFGKVCMFCRAGMHPLCDDPVASTCCCGGDYTLDDHLRAIELDEAIHRGKITGAEELQEALLMAEHRDELQPRTKEKRDELAPGEPVVRDVGDSGYIDPAAWNSTAHIGTLKDPESTGRKRAAAMYPITPGTVCEWARLKDAGGGPRPILGCLNNPATDWHHGPDKNTLNNAKVSRGIGATENLHLVCSECHNAWHAANDPLFPPYDRVADQEKPWLPFTAEPWGPQTPSPASIDELMEQERAREQQRRDRGRDHRGRNTTAKPPGQVADGPLGDEEAGDELD